MIKEKVYNFIVAYRKTYGKYPSVNWLSDKCKISEEEVKQAQKDLVSESRLRFTGNKSVKIEEKKIIEERLHFSKELFLFVVCCFTYFVCVVISVYYSSIYLFDVLPFFPALLLASGSVLYLSSWVELSEYFFKQKTVKNFLFGVLSSFVGIVMLCASIFFTVAGQFNIVQSSTVTPEKELYAQYQKQISDIDTEIARLKTSLLNYEKVLSGIDRYAGGGAYWLNTDKRIKEVSEDIKKLQEEKNLIISSMTELLKDGSVSSTKKTFSNWLSTIIKVAPNIIDFISRLFLGVFVDFVSPICLHGLLLFYKKISD